MPLLPPIETRRKRGWRTAMAVAVVGALTLQHPDGPAYSQQDQPLAANLEIVGHTDLGGRGSNAYVWAYRNVAYVGSSGERGLASPDRCPGLGVAIVDLTDTSRPTMIGTVAGRPGTSAADVQVLAVDSAAFRGDLLATGIQSCTPDGVGGLSLWDVTDPQTPAELGFFEVGRGPLGVHEFSVFRREGRAIGLLAVPYSETLDPEKQGDLRIVDLADPLRPVQLASWGMERAFGIGARAGQGRDPQNHAHSVEASADGRYAYVSYWDGGVIILDVSDLRNPRFVGRTVFEPDEEGNAHSSALAKGGRVLIEADENPFVRNDAVVVEGGGLPLRLDAAYGSFRPVLQRTGSASGRLVFVGHGCPGVAATPTSPAIAEDPYAAEPAGAVALIDRGGCGSVEKVLRAQRRGAVGVLIGNSEPGLISPDGDIGEVRIPAAAVSQQNAELMKAALGRGETVRVGFAAEPVSYTDWGSLRLWDISDPVNPVQMARFATDDSATDRETGPPDGGWYTAHQPVVLGDRLYLAWYSDGVRVLDIADPTQPREVGFFVPAPQEPTVGDAGARPRRPSVWGVFVRGDIILASDEQTGLYVLRDLSRFMPN